MEEKLLDTLSNDPDLYVDKVDGVDYVMVSERSMLLNLYDSQSIDQELKSIIEDYLQSLDCGIAIKTGGECKLYQYKLNNLGYEIIKLNENDAVKKSSGLFLSNVFYDNEQLIKKFINNFSEEEKNNLFDCLISYNSEDYFSFTSIFGELTEEQKNTLLKTVIKNNKFEIIPDLVSDISYDYERLEELLNEQIKRNPESIIDKNLIFGIDVYNDSTLSEYIPLINRVLLNNGFMYKAFEELNIGANLRELTQISNLTDDFRELLFFDLINKAAKGGIRGINSTFRDEFFNFKNESINFKSSSYTFEFIPEDLINICKKEEMTSPHEGLDLVIRLLNLSDETRMPKDILDFFTARNDDVKNFYTHIESLIDKYPEFKTREAVNNFKIMIGKHIRDLLIEKKWDEIRNSINDLFVKLNE